MDLEIGKNLSELIGMLGCFMTLAWIAWLIFKD